MTSRSGPIRVLHVVEDRNFAELTKVYLQKNGAFEVTVATDVEAPLDRIADGDCDCIVSDYELPEQNGIELLEAVRERDSDFPFILFAGEGSEAVASRAISAGVTDYLRKGSGSDTFELLANRITNAVRSHQTEQELRSEQRLSERIVQASPIAIVVHDRDGDIVLANERANEILGAEGTELAADAYESSTWELRDADGALIPYERLPFTRVVDGEELRNEPYTVNTGDGRTEQIVVHGAPLRDEDGSIEGAIIPFRLANETG